MAQIVMAHIVMAQVFLANAIESGFTRRS